MTQFLVKFSLVGRSGRRDFLLTNAYVLLTAVVLAICMSGLLPGSLGGQAGVIWRDIFGFPLHYFFLFKDADQEQLALLGLIGSIWLLFAGILGAIAVRRLHDLGRTGLWIALMFFVYFFKNLPDQILFQIPFSHRTVAYIAGSLRTAYQLTLFAYIVFLGLFPGQRGSNRYGPEPVQLPAS